VDLVGSDADYGAFTQEALGVRKSWANVRGKSWGIYSLPYFLCSFPICA
jgi:hypothetical protein